MKLKSKCCRKYEKKGKACKRCPLVAILGKKPWRKRLEKTA